VHASLLQTPTPSISHTRSLVHFCVRHTGAPRLPPMLHKTCFPPKRKLSARGTQFFVPAMKQLVARTGPFDGVAACGTLHPSSCRAKLVGQVETFGFRQEVGVNVRTPLKDAQQVGRKGGVALKAGTPMQSVGIAGHRDRRA